jgi:hypothetical protein
VRHSTGEIQQHTSWRTLRLKENKAGVVIAGSIPQFLTGQNVQPANCGDVATFIEEVSGRLGASIAGAKVRRLDIAGTLQLDDEPLSYCHHLKGMTRYQRATAANSVQFRTEARTLSFYDKGRQSGTPGNLLRYELQLKKGVQDTFGRDLYLNDLATPEVFRQCAELWKDSYLAVEKNALIVPLYKVRTLKEFENLLVAHGGKGIGEASIEAILSRVPERGKRSRMRALVRRAAGFAGEPSRAMEELDSKILAMAAGVA